MENALHITAIWMHILGIALFVGPQFFLAVAWVPASRQITDVPERIQAMRTITRRFGYLGGIGLGLIFTAGLYLFANWRSYYAQHDAGFFELRYGVIFTIKMCVLAVMLASLALHMFIVGPNLLARLEAQANGDLVTEAELRRLRIRSMTLSILSLALTLAIMVMGAMLNTYKFSQQ